MKPSKYYSIARRVMVQFFCYSLFMSLVFSVFSFLFLYVIEDEFIDQSIESESTRLISAFDQHGQWPAQTSSRNMQLYFELASLPEVVSTTLAHSPDRREIVGDDGEHFHIKVISQNPTVYLLAEVSQQLIVRPMRPFIIKFLLMATLVLTALGLFMVYRLAKYWTNPLVQLASVVESIAPSELKKGFSSDYPNNEVGVLARSLESSMVRLDNFVTREINFTRDASHELRTPIAVIKNSLELLSQSYTLLPEHQVLVSRIERSNFKMEQTMACLLSLAREEAVDDKESIAVLPVVENVVIHFDSLIGTKPIEFDIDIGITQTVMSNVPTLQILLGNLISNAIQYSTEGLIEINLNGNVFCIKNQLSTKVDEIKGYGIGLTLVERLCRHLALGYRVSTSNETFMVEIEFCD